MKNFTVTTVYSRDGAQKGTSKSSSYLCQMAGCTGRRMAVHWPDGKITRPCTKGMFTRPDGDQQLC